jgi:tetratricopeptide (TPR) repeat protein
MYKDRLREWGVRKYLCEREALAMARIKAERDLEGKETEFFMSGLSRFDISKVAQHLEKKSLTIASPGPKGRAQEGKTRGRGSVSVVRASTPPLQIALRSPGHLHDMEGLLANVRTWMDGSFENQSWRVGDDEGVLALDFANKEFTTFLLDGIILLEGGRYQDSFRLLNLAFAKVKELLLESHPLLVLVVLCPLSYAYLSMGAKGRHLGKMLIEYMEKMATKVLPSGHPLMTLWRGLRRTVDCAESRDQYESLGQVILQWLVDHFAIYSGVVTRAYTLFLIYACWDHADNPYHRAERQFRQSLERLVALDPSTSCRWRALRQGWLRYELAEMLMRQKKCDEAAALLQEIIHDHTAPTGTALAPSFKTLGQVERMRGRFDRACEAFAGGICCADEALGQENRLSISMLHDLGDMLLHVGDKTGAAEALDERERRLRMIEESQGIETVAEMMIELRVPSCSI